jgi:hypothetical protein
MQTNMDTHIKLLGWLNIGLGILGLLIGAFVFLILVGVGTISGDQEAMMILGVVGVFVGGFLVLLSLPGIIAGYGLLRRQTWARYLALIVGFLSLFNVPVGTLIGGYTLWVLLQDRAAAEFH